jgi:hypothetical protein
VADQGTPVLLDGAELALCVTGVALRVDGVWSSIAGGSHRRAELGWANREDRPNV